MPGSRSTAEPIGEPEGLRDNFKPLMTVVAGGKNRGL
jgi:hypothetical protein